MEREQAGFGIVQRVENVVHEAGAEAAEGGHFFSLDELGLGLLDFPVRPVEGDVLFGELGVEALQIAVAFLKVMFALVQFIAKSKLPKPQAAVEITAGDDDHRRATQEKKVVGQNGIVFPA